MKVLKIRHDGKKVVFENIVEAMDFLDSLEIPPKDKKDAISEEEMSEEDFNNLKEFDGF